MAKRTHYSAEFKSKVALEAAKELSTLAELSSKYKVHAVQISKWKQELLEGSIGIFSTQKKSDSKAVLKYGFQKLLLNEIVSFTAAQNMRSRKIMEKIGLHHNPKDDFDHPKLPEEHPLRRHVLYRLRLDEWQKMQNTVNYEGDI